MVTAILIALEPKSQYTKYGTMHIILISSDAYGSFADIISFICACRHLVPLSNLVSAYKELGTKLPDSPKALKF